MLVRNNNEFAPYIRRLPQFLLPMPLLNVLGTSAAAAFSLRLLKLSHRGPCVNVRRSVDNKQMDLYFTGHSLDVGTAYLFAQSGQLFVTKWYDQSGSGNDAIQATAANQPQLVLNSINGKPAVRFDGSTSYLFKDQASPSTISGSFTLFYVGTLLNGSGASNGTIFVATDRAGSQPGAVGLSTATGNSATPNLGTTAFGVGPSAYTPIVGTPFQFATEFTLNGSTVSASNAFNNGAPNNFSGAQTATTFASAAIGIGSNITDNGGTITPTPYSHSDTGEIILVPSNIWGGRGIAYASQRAYWGTP